MFINFGLLKTEIKNWKSRPDLEGRAQAHAPEKSYAIGLIGILQNNQVYHLMWWVKVVFIILIHMTINQNHTS